MIRRGSREGGGRRNLALVQLQSCDHPSWICLFPPDWEQPARISACGYASPQLCQALQPPFADSMDTPLIPRDSLTAL